MDRLVQIGAEIKLDEWDFYTAEEHLKHVKAFILHLSLLALTKKEATYLCAPEPMVDPITSFQIPAVTEQDYGAYWVRNFAWEKYVSATKTSESFTAVLAKSIDYR